MGFIQLRLNEDGLSFVNDNNANQFIFNMGSNGNALQLTSQNSKELILDNFQLNQLNLANITAVQQQQPPPLDPKKQQQSQAKKRRKKNDADPNSNDSNIEKSPLPTAITSNEIINSQQQQQQHEIQKDMHYFDNFNQSNSFKLNQNLGSSFLNLDTNMNNFNQQHHMHPPLQQQQQSQFQQQHVINHQQHQQQQQQQQQMHSPLVDPNLQPQNNYYKSVILTGDPNLYRANQLINSSIQDEHVHLLTKEEAHKSMLSMSELQERPNSQSGAQFINSKAMLNDQADMFMQHQHQQQHQMNSNSFFSDNNLEKFLQLDGTNDEVEKLITRMETSGDNKNVPHQAPPQQQPVVVHQRSQARNSQSQHNVQSYLKLNSPVVLNHELLASYGVSLNGQQQQPQQSDQQKTAYQKTNAVKLLTPSKQDNCVTNNYVNAPHLIPISLTSLQANNLNNSQSFLDSAMRSINTMNSSDSERHLIINHANSKDSPPNQIYYTNLANIQSTSGGGGGGLKNGNKSIKLLMNMQNNNNNMDNNLIELKRVENDKMTGGGDPNEHMDEQHKLQQLMQLQQLNKTHDGLKVKKETGRGHMNPPGAVKIEGSITNLNANYQLMPNLNGDNTLLKALLQTAPKNASNFNNQTVVGIVQTGEHSSGLMNQDGHHHQQQQQQQQQQQMISNNSFEVSGFKSADMLLSQMSAIKQENTHAHDAESATEGANEQKKKGKNSSKQFKQQQTSVPTGGVAEQNPKTTKNSNQTKANTFKLNEGNSHD